MFNFESKTVTCDHCGAVRKTECTRRTEAVKEVEKEDWKYSGIGGFACPKCVDADK